MVLAIISYKWILVAAVLVLMLIIGYIADATDFGHKKFGKAKPKDNPNEVKEVEDVVENKTIQDVNVLNEDLNVPFGDVQVDSFSKLPEENYSNEDLTIPLENVEPANEENAETVEDTPVEETVEEVSEEPVEENAEEITPTEEVTEPLVEEIKLDEEEPVEEVKAEPKKKNEKKKSKKSLEDTKTNYEEKIVPEFITEQFGDDSFVSSDDDIWKF